MKKTKLKRGKGGLMAFFAAVVLMVNVAPAVAGGTGWSGIPDWLMLAMTIYDKLVSEGEGGGDKIRCYSAGNPGRGGFVECSTCMWKDDMIHTGDSKSKCTPR